jgi:hypothetical protein
MKTEYFVVCRETLTELEEIVNHHLAQGCALQGGIFVLNSLNGESHTGKYYYQSITKETP